MATSAAGQQTGHLLYVTDRQSRLRFQVDTSSEVSIIPPSKAERKNRKDTFGLLTVNNSTVVTYGTRSLMLTLGLHHTFRWVFTMANVRNPILGTDDSWIPECNFLFRELFPSVRHPAPHYY